MRRFPMKQTNEPFNVSSKIRNPTAAEESSEPSLKLDIPIYHLATQFHINAIFHIASQAFFAVLLQP